MLAFLSLSLLGLLTAAAPLEPRAVRPTATIDTGEIRGVQTMLPGLSNPVNKFLGIPYAVSPPKRFAKPQPAKNFSNPLDTTVLMPACIQQFSSGASQSFALGVFNQPTPAESEDCLYTNVYAPAGDAARNGSLPVMFWIYGGGLVFGTGSLPQYDGSAFAAYQDVIVVTHNYRTNVFGFPNSPYLAESDQNLGVYDMRLALDWTRRNIAAFGGDPDKITVFGESAGAGLVDTLISTHTEEDAPFRAAIMESTQNAYSYQAPSDDPQKGWRELARVLGCTDPATEFACVQTADAHKVKTLIQDRALSFTMQKDDVVNPRDPVALRRAGNFAKVPIMIGTNSNEGLTFVTGVENVGIFLRALLGDYAPKSIPELLKAFPVSSILFQNQEVADVATFLGFQCLIAMYSNDTVAQQVPTWRYYFDAAFPNTAFADDSGAYHSSEIQSVFQTYSGGPVNAVTPQPEGLVRTNLQPTDQQKALSQFMNKAWADFAKNPTAGPGWPEYRTSNGGIAHLGADGSHNYTLVNQATLDGRCPLFYSAYRAVNPGISIPALDWIL